MKVTFNSRANREVRSISAYYTREAGAQRAQEFLDELDTAIKRIKLSPRSFAAINADFRRALLNKYPYVVLYEIESDVCVRILAEGINDKIPILGWLDEFIDERK